MDQGNEACGIQAVIWDYDGTLVDTRRKNLQVTRALLPAVSGRPIDSFPDLASLESYQAAAREAENWRELFGRILGLNDEEVDEAGRLWTSYQLRDQTPAPFFPGISEAIAGLDGLPQAIFSQNSKSAIQRSLSAAGLGGYISLVIGYEQVTFSRQKPAPDGLLLCLAEMGLDRGLVCFVGDHETDILCARRANAVLSEKQSDVRVIAVGADFDGQAKHSSWSQTPDHVASAPLDVAALVGSYRPSSESSAA